MRLGTCGDVFRGVLDVGWVVVVGIVLSDMYWVRPVPVFDPLERILGLKAARVF